MELHGRVSFEGKTASPAPCASSASARTSPRASRPTRRYAPAKPSFMASSAPPWTPSSPSMSSSTSSSSIAPPKPSFSVPHPRRSASPPTVLSPKTLREAHRDHVRRNESEGFTKRSTDSPAILTGRRADGEEFPWKPPSPWLKPTERNLHRHSPRYHRAQAGRRGAAKQAELIDLAHNTIISSVTSMAPSASGTLAPRSCTDTPKIKPSAESRTNCSAPSFPSRWPRSKPTFSARTVGRAS